MEILSKTARSVGVPESWKIGLRIGSGFFINETGCRTSGYDPFFPTVHATIWVKWFLEFYVSSKIPESQCHFSRCKKKSCLNRNLMLDVYYLLSAKSFLIGYFSLPSLSWHVPWPKNGKSVANVFETRRNPRMNFITYLKMNCRECLKKILAREARRRTA